MSKYVLTKEGNLIHYDPSREDNDELMHYGVKGMKWGIRKQKKYSNYVQSVKKRHSTQHYADKAKNFEDELREVKKQNYKNWAKDNYLDDYSDRDQKYYHKQYQWQLDSDIKSAKHYMKNSQALSKKLDSIDTSNLTFKQAKKLVKQYENDWLNETSRTDEAMAKKYTY